MGLLEQRVLVVRRVSQGYELLNESGQPVGHARWRQLGWWRWILHVYEQEQSPLVCSVRTRLGWPPRREIRDAEGELVGFLTRQLLLNRWECVAFRFHAGRFLSEAGVVLATWSNQRLEFAEGVRHDPFAKMLLVAAVVAH